MVVLADGRRERALDPSASAFLPFYSAFSPFYSALPRLDRVVQNSGPFAHSVEPDPSGNSTVVRKSEIGTNTSNVSRQPQVETVSSPPQPSPALPSLPTRTHLLQLTLQSVEGVHDTGAAGARHGQPANAQGLL